MSKILLVIDHLGPDVKAFHYATHLCRSIRTELAILQIAVATNGTGKIMRQDTWAPADDRLDQLITEAENEGIRCSVTVKTGRSDNEIIRYVDTHKDILLAIYDRMESIRIKSKKYNDARLASNLLVPVVRVHTSRPFRKLREFNNILMEVTKMGNAFRKIAYFMTGKRRKKVSAEMLVSGTGNQSCADSQPQETIEANLVVVGNESSFSEEIIDYAIEMAVRMNYRIIALNTAPLSCETFKLFSSSRNQICNDFESIAIKNAKKFEEKARTQALSFTHIVKFVETDEALEELQAELGEIGFIVSEPQSRQTNQRRSENENRPLSEICVYSLR